MGSIKVSIGGGVPLLLFVGGAMLSFLTMPELGIAGRALSSLTVGFTTAAAGTAGGLMGGLAGGMGLSATHKSRVPGALSGLLVTLALYGGLALGTYEGYSRTRDYIIDHHAAQQQRALPPVAKPPVPSV